MQGYRYLCFAPDNCYSIGDLLYQFHSSLVLWLFEKPGDNLVYMLQL